MRSLNNMGLYLVTDSEILKERDFYKAIEDSLKAGVNIIQLREKNLDGKKFLERALKLRVLTRKYNALFIINDRVDIAMLSDADGVHVGQGDLNAKDVRALIGKEKIIGVSTRTIEEAFEAKKNGADYLGVGAMFSTSTKLDAKVVSNETLREIRSNCKLPIVAIGGLKLDNIHNIERCEGYAVISAILEKENIEEETKKWMKEIKKENVKKKVI